jgi:glucose-6-phosphate dehydrogenase assembly protein OpcA
VADAVTAGAIGERRRPRSVPFSRVERELDQLWAGLEGPDGAAQTRALMANVVAFCRSRQEEAAIVDDIATIVARHPSRVVVLTADAASEADEIEALVAAHGRSGDGGEQLCGEHVMLRAGGPSARSLPSAVRSLVLGDLPTALWWATPEAPPLAGDLFDELAGEATQVIYDSMAWTDPLRQLVVTARWIATNGGQATSDLAWRRPKLWRRLIAQMMDPALAPGAIDNITEVDIEHGPHTLTQAWLLSGWLAFRLGWQPRGGRVLPGPEVSWSFDWEHGMPRVNIRRLPEGESEIRSIRIATRVHDRPVTFRFTWEGPGRLHGVAHGLSDRVVSLTGPVQTRGALVARQLPDYKRDRLFESAVALARTMAEAVL